MADTIGPQDASWALVSRSPGKHDVRNGEPFSGPSGKVVNYLLDKNDMRREDVILTNVVLCQTDDPPKEAIECCSKRLENDLDEVDTILAGGVEAVRSILHKTVGKARGLHHTIEYGGRERTAVATFNPAYCLREASYFPSIRDDFRRAANPARPFRAPQVTVTNTLAGARRLLRRLQDEPILAIDTETTGRTYGSKLVSIGFASSGGRADVLGVRVCKTPAGIIELRNFFDKYDGKQLWHNGQFDTKILRYWGCSAKVSEDTLLLSYACDERSEGVHGLDYLTQNELEWPYYTPPAVAEGKTNGFTRDHNGEPFTQWDELYTYNGYDCCGSYLLYGILRERAILDGVIDRYRRVLIPGTNAFSKVEARGILLDVPKLEHIRDVEIKPKLVDISVNAGQLIREPINLNSPQQCAAFIYDKMKVRDPKLNYRPSQEKPKVRSVDEKHRDWIAQNVTNETVLRFVAFLHEFKKLDKLRGTYLDGLLPFVGADGRIRGELLLYGTETSRLSSRRPNLQNQPRTTDADIARGEGYVNIRQLYKADPGGIVIAADYSQVELRTAAVLSQDEFLLTIYSEGKDLHDEMAAFLFGKSFTQEQRVAAKAANFGCLFGIQGWYFGQLFGLPTDEATRVIARWWERVPQLSDWCARTRDRGRKDGYVRTAFGHKRRFPLITDENVDHVLKEMVNTPVQGTASDFTTCAIIDLEEDNALDPIGAGIVLAVHDSTLALAHSSHAKEACQTIKEYMEAQPANRLGWTDIPFSVEVKTGPDWGHVVRRYERNRRYKIRHAISAGTLLGKSCGR